MTSSESVSMMMNSILMLLNLWVITCSFHDVWVQYVHEMGRYCSGDTRVSFAWCRENYIWINCWFQLRLHWALILKEVENSEQKWLSKLIINSKILSMFFFKYKLKFKCYVFKSEYPICICSISPPKIDRLRKLLRFVEN